MPVPELLAAESPAALLAYALQVGAEVASDPSWCFVVPRTQLRQDLEEAILQAAGAPHWSGYRVVTLDELLDHYLAQLDASRTLTPLQLRQLVAASVLESHLESGATRFRGQVSGDRVSEATLRSLSRLVADLEPIGLGAQELSERLGAAQPRTAADALAGLRAQAERVSDVYGRVQGKMTRGDFVGPRTRLAHAADLAEVVPPPFGARSFLFLGFDATSPHDVGLRLLRALGKRHDVQRCLLALVLPASHDTGWTCHGNDRILRHWRAAYGAEPVVQRVPEALAAEATRVSPDLRALAEAPFAFASRERPTATTVRVVLAPDPTMELEWVATDIKRQLLARPDLVPSDVAIVARRMDDVAGEVARAGARVGLPVYTSVPVRLCDVPAVRALLALFRLPAHGWRLRDLRFVAECPYLGFGLDGALLAQAALGVERLDSASAWLHRLEALAESARESRTARRLRTREVAASAAHDTEPQDGGSGDAPPIGPAAAPPAAPPLTVPPGLADPSWDEQTREEDARDASWLGLFATFRALVGALDLIQASAPSLVPGGWVQALQDAAAKYVSAARITAPTPHVPHLQQAELARLDFDGVNRLTQASDEWLKGREVAELDDRPLAAPAWYDELAAMAEVETIRVTTYTREAVHALDPEQASLRRWRLVYVIGLTDGSFPLHVEPDEQTLSDVERRALDLPTLEERAARERLYFQLAVAAAREQVTFTAPSIDDRGKALVRSPYLMGLGLRLRDVPELYVSAHDLVPDGEHAVFARSDIDMLAADRYRALLEAVCEAPDPLPAHAAAVTGGPTLIAPLPHRAPHPASPAGADDAPLVGRPPVPEVVRLVPDPSNGVADALTARISRDPLLSTWLLDGAGARLVETWATERARARATAGLPLEPGLVPFAPFTGLLPAGDVPAALATTDATFSPSDFTLYERCHFRFFAVRALGVRDRPDGEEEHDEASAFGTLQHAILQTLHERLERAGHWPPPDAAAVATALGQLPGIARHAVARYTASAHAELWPMDLAFVTDILRHFVRRDLTRLLRAGSRPDAPMLRTRLVGLEVALGGDDAPLRFVGAGEHFRLKGTIDRLEAIDDPRVPKAAGWLVVRDYKSGGLPWMPKPDKYLAAHLEGRHLQLPLYAAMAGANYQARVFGFGELWTSRADDPPMIAVRRVVSDGAGIRLDDPMPDVQNVVRSSADAALARAGTIVHAVRRGEFAPQADRNCYGCHLRDVCRAARSREPESGRARARMPLAVTVAEYDRAAAAASAADARAVAG